MLFPLTFLSNAFVHDEDARAALQTFVEHQPGLAPRHGRAAMVNDQQVTGDLWLALLGAAVVVAIFAPLTVRAYMRKA